jgi:predicted lipase
VQSDVRQHVKALVEKHPTFNLNFIGHSLGGALATIAAADINSMYRETLKDRIQVFSYGSPRVGNREFSNYISDSFKIYRTTHKTDVVPHYPLQIFGFTHPRREHWINMDNRVVECFDDDDEDSKCSNSIGLLDFYDFISHIFGYFEFAIGPWC